MRPIGKGARFLVLSGDLRGHEFSVSSATTDERGFWTLDVPGHPPQYAIASVLEGSCFKRLPDVPAEVDPLFAEIAAHDIGERGSDGPQSTLDEIRWAGTIPDHDLDIASDDPFRAAFVEIAALAFAGIRAIDGR